MAAKRLPDEYPVITDRRVDSFERVYARLKDLILAVTSFRRDVVEVANDHADLLDVSSQAGAPTSTPTAIGLRNLDTTAKAMYIAVGTASSADWKKITP